MSWAAGEMKTINLGDKRLNERLLSLFDKLGNSPNLSIPAACGGWHETKAAYRFFDHEQVTTESILAPHIESTLARMKQHSVVLLLQDTTTLNFTGQKEREDIGPINHEKHLGLLLHPILAVTPERLCLGVLDTYHWAREKVRHRTAREKSRDNHKIPLEEKESHRWLKAYRKANEVALQVPDTMLITVADREADIYDLYHEAQHAQSSQENTAAYWLIRSSSNRRILNDDGRPDQEKLIEKTKSTPPLCTITFEIPAKEKQVGRYVTQNLYATELTLCPPDRKRKISTKYGDKTVIVTVVVATEIDSPEGQEPLEWVLLTNVKIHDATGAHNILKWYLCRWQIEVYFRILKSGCQVEKLQLNDKSRFDPCLTLYMIIAWRILYLTILGRECPDISCELIFSTEEWKMAHLIVKKEAPPAEPPPLKVMIKIIASMGGYMNRKNDPEPGPTTLWIGLQRLKDFLLAQQTLGEITYG
ncbi:IS4 family transposase [Legionella pneumophila serogroup 1]|nr:IS4 family transposase [Legionella pneumophila]QIB24805.1 IS4 family transposase [Legionella pneumophila]QIB24807.1 IS4 family transposase [Legionella pneumophila]CZH48651.1 Transposase for transposon Tn5 [Legionella pneumophila]